MLIRDVSVTPAVATMLARAMGDATRDATLAAYRDGGGPALYGWSVAGTLVCVAGVSVDGARAELAHLGTAPGRERRGHAAALLHAVAGDLPVDSLVAETDDDAVGFYRRAGFAVEPVDSPWSAPRFRCTLHRSD